MKSSKNRHEIPEQNSRSHPTHYSCQGQWISSPTCDGASPSCSSSARSALWVDTSSSISAVPRKIWKLTHLRPVGQKTPATGQKNTDQHNRLEIPWLLSQKTPVPIENMGLTVGWTVAFMLSWDPWDPPLRHGHPQRRSSGSRCGSWDPNGLAIHHRTITGLFFHGKTWKNSWKTHMRQWEFTGKWKKIDVVHGKLGKKNDFVHGKMGKKTILFMGKWGKSRFCSWENWEQLEKNNGKWPSGPWSSYPMYH